MDFEKIFDTLEIEVQKLEPNYTPDDYGRKLMQNVYNQNDVSYSTYTSQNNMNEYVFTGKI